MLHLKVETPPEWAGLVLDKFETFLADHAACERKAMASAMRLVASYQDRPGLVTALVELAREELEHFQQVWTLMNERGLLLGPEMSNPYADALRKEVRQGRDRALMDRLIIGAIIEARACERLGLVARALPDGELKEFYLEFTRSEARHHQQYLALARDVASAEEVRSRMEELLEVEGKVIAGLPLRPTIQ